jgi:hypothetical protein
MKYNIPSEFKPFLNSVKRQCKTYGVELMLSPSKNVILTDDFLQECSGYFEDTEKVLVVACGKPTHEWMQILVHEFCHMEQWKSDDRWDKWADACGKLWAWMDGTSIMNKSQLSKVLDDMIELEKDCEMRSVEKIEKWGLPIDTELYTRRANCYLYSYGLMDKLKRFPTGVYTNEVLVNMMPSKFQKSYKKVPRVIEEYMVNMYAKK